MRKKERMKDHGNWQILSAFKDDYRGTGRADCKGARCKRRRKAVAFTDDRKMLRMESIDGEYKDIMYYAVNVLSREAGGCEISFDHFDTEALEKALKEK